MEKKRCIPEVFRPSEVANLLRVKVQMIHYLMRIGEIHYIGLGKKKRIPRYEVERILGQKLEFVDLTCVKKS